MYGHFIQKMRLSTTRYDFTVALQGNQRVYNHINEQKWPVPLHCGTRKLVRTSVLSSLSLRSSVVIFSKQVASLSACMTVITVI